MRIMHMLHSLDCEVGAIGVTVRRGPKWADSMGEMIELCVCSNDNVQHVVSGTARVKEIWRGPLEEVPAKLIENEHEIRSQQYSGLLASMRKAYGAGLSEDDEVTVVSYLRLS